MTERQSFTRGQVTRHGFEARCVADEHVEYLWHDNCGLRADRRSRSTTLLLDPSVLPEGPWWATDLGQRELRDKLPLDQD